MKKVPIGKTNYVSRFVPLTKSTSSKKPVGPPMYPNPKRKVK